MSLRRVVVVGGGAAGFFAAIACAEAFPEAQVTLLEKSSQFLGKVRISGGGRCNVTHACFDVRELTARYPRGERVLLGACQTFQASDTVAWFETRGVKLKTENDGRMFPTTDSSETIIDCLTRSAHSAGVKALANRGVTHITKEANGVFAVTLATGESLLCDRLLLATGGCRAAAAGELARSLGHALESPVPSLFTFHIDTSWVRELSGVAVGPVAVSVPGTKLREQGPLLMTHWGLSGPVILRLSAWGARALHALNYQFPLHINWLPQDNAEQIAAELDARRAAQPARLVVNTTIASIPGRLWEQLVLASGLPRPTRWAELGRSAQHALLQQLIRTELAVTGKSLNKDEFVTCGGVRLSEVNFKTMESRICPGLYFAGELLDVDGITGGFNFQAAWTTGWIAGQSMAR
ncbi:MAG TPA: NAD(P)/FAD-dependent oxidoreductase [Candidatus Saccharimonadales bacterium]|nr:NAD(P)/FAD-dependent oxidoreductase [Candidatus Saccharimonadales bacterium]